MLEESHATNRYRLRHIPRPIPLKYSHCRNIDIYFTDGAGVNVMASSGGVAPVQGDLLTAADILLRADLWGLYDFSDLTKITQSNSTTLTGFEAANDPNQAFLTTNGSTVLYADFGTNSGKCISFSGDWIRLTDSSGVQEPSQGVLCLLFSTQSVQDQYAIFDFGYFKAYANNGVLSYDIGITNADTTMILQNDQDYLLTMVYDGTKGATEYGGLQWRLEDLGNNTPQSYFGKHFGSNSLGSYDFGATAS
ncbi:MAG: hypothetical protein OTJ97_05700, partial [SAR202 cluster bacterium]|nr:hypothetical protein [SAR202 cluster bacterium]